MVADEDEFYRRGLEFIKAVQSSFGITTPDTGHTRRDNLGPGIF